MVNNAHWSKRSQPKLVAARHPRQAGTFVTLAVHPDTWGRMWAHQMHAKVGEYAGLVHGSYVESGDELPALVDPQGIFRGLKRPLHDFQVAHDAQVMVYVTNPPCTYHWPHKFDGYPVRQQKPLDSVFVTFVDYSARSIGELPTGDASYSAGKIDGVVLYWAWHRASENDSFLPSDYRNRYEERVL